METLNLSQQRGLFDPAYANKVTVIGVGGVGGNVVHMLTKMGVPDITVYDDDGVETHNVCMSVYKPTDVGLLKVRALEKIVHEQSGASIHAIDKKYVGEHLTGTVVMCVDNMEARAFIWKQAKGNPNVNLFIDTRTAGEFISIFAINPCDPEDKEYYNNFFYSSSEAIRQDCGLHGLYDINVHVATIVTRNLRNYWKNGKKKQHHEESCVNILEV